MPIIGVIASSAKGAPAAPIIGTATNIGTGRAYNNGAATVTFTPGAGATATSFTATSSPGGFTGTGASSPITVAGLQSAVSYTFTVTATNAAGTSPASAASNSITATTVPQAPTIGTATVASATSVSVAFTAGATGGSAITSFTATSSPGSITNSGATSPRVVTGLTSGTAYTFTVTATNANGTSTASAASNSVTPNAVLSAWTLSTALPSPSNPTNVRGVGGMANQDSVWINGYNANLTNSIQGYYWRNGTSTWDTANQSYTANSFSSPQRVSASSAASITGYDWNTSQGIQTRSYISSANTWSNIFGNYPTTNYNVGFAAITGGIRYAGGVSAGNNSYSQSAITDSSFTTQQNWPQTGEAYAIDAGTVGGSDGLWFPRTGANVYRVTSATANWTTTATQPDSGSWTRNVTTNNTYILYSNMANGASSIIYLFSPTANTFTNIGTVPTSKGSFSIAFDRTSDRVRGVESDSINAADRRHWFATIA